MATPGTVAFHTLGCKLNFAESSSIAQQFLKAGYQEVAFEESSDLYIINTCSVTEQADKKCRKAVRQAKQKNADAAIVVIGCYAQLKPDEIASIPGVSLVLGAAEKFNILDHLDRPLHQLPTSIYAQPIQSLHEFVPSFSIEDRTRSFLKVQDGCDYKCSFCTIPQARGPSRSGSIASLVTAAQSLVEKGVQEIVLTGVNIGDYGKSFSGPSHGNFLQLIQQLDKISDPVRFRISSIEPNLCSDEVIDFVFSSNHFMPHFHMPLQSGDDQILGKMQRRYKTALYAERVKRIKQVYPASCIGVDVIAGFPGETGLHFDNTYNFLHALDISYLHVFTYSERNNTLAASFEHTVAFPERKERSDRLRILSEKKKRVFYEQQLGRQEKVLVENDVRGDFLMGWTSNYVRTAVPAAMTRPNETVCVALKSIAPELYAVGEPILVTA